ncbi:DUF6270 domain-containing protein [Terrabacter sp. MAHUQ-38]|uniref:DUF6270 domain-containing protein n=1 Tax=unclassified Terrabacter TaxID=2630222 RepID=UPI00165D96A2|nr:DUF6270 domain-containing protein [Terrabacter sp. MAHUQ-38]MBC9821927.1 hypothetical protein [Terrabacter sp. MAHUQ-38]
MPTALRLGVLGSCVSRDMAALHRECAVVLYVARQSFISAVSPGVSVAPGAGLTSPFQQRMLESDLGSTGLELLQRHAPELDLLVIDLVDERLGVVPLAGGSYVTDSQELKESGTKDLLEVVGDDLELGTPEHFRRWCGAAGRVVDVLRRTGLLERTVVLRVPFAQTTADGSPVAAFMGRSALEWDELYAPYYEHLQHLGLPVVALPRALAVSDSAHRWGPAPYHYNPEAYGWLLDAARRAVRVHDDPVLAPLPRSHVRMPLSVPVVGIANPATAGSIRFPVELAADVRRWRLRVRNLDQRTGRSLAGRVDLTGLWLGVDAGNGALAAQPVRLMSARTLPSGGRELVTAWFDRPLAAGRWSLSAGWRAETARAVVVSLADTYRSPDPDAAGESGAEGFSASRYTPLTWALELEVPETVPVVVGWGDERLLSRDPGAELSSSPVSRAAHDIAGVPVHVVHPGTGLALWNGYSSQWSDAALPEPAHEVFHAMGTRDVLAGTPVEQLRTMFTDTLAKVRRGWGPHVTAVLVDDGTISEPTHAESARAFNRWLLDTHPGPVARIRDGAFERVRPALERAAPDSTPRQVNA